MKKIVAYALMMILLIAGVWYVGRPETESEPETEPEPEVHTVGESQVEAQFESGPVEYRTVAEAKKVLPFEVLTPALAESGYLQTKILIIDEAILEIHYSGADNRIVYRTGEGMGNISGDYELYEVERKLNVYGVEVTLKGRGVDSILLAYFEKGDLRYSLSFRQGISEEELVEIVEYID